MSVFFEDDGSKQSIDEQTIKDKLHDLKDQRWRLTIEESEAVAAAMAKGERKWYEDVLSAGYQNRKGKAMAEARAISNEFDRKSKCINDHISKLESLLE
jgi:hypothetical protein